jgi:hypothetical protein
MKYTKQIILISILLFFATFRIQAQTSLPTSWDCTPGTMPVGWTTNITGYYTSASYIHSAPNAAKFDATGIFLTINFVDEPDTLIYYLRGASFTGGTFNIQQSVDGLTWNVVRTFTGANIPNTSLANAAPFKDALSKYSRYVRFIYTIKSAGNVAVDDIRISLRPPGPEANIKIKFNNLLVPSGGTLVAGNDTTFYIRVFNSGTDSTLKLTSALFSGTDASMFSQTTIPTTIGPVDSADIMLHFSPIGADGTKTATLSIANNVPDKDPYILNIWAVKGCCATEPIQAAADLNFSYVKSYKFRVNFSDGSTPPEKYLVLKKDSPISEEPVDGQTYHKGDYIGGAQVAYMGASGYFYPSNVVANTHYYIKIFSLNGYSGYENYLTSSTISADTTTFENMIGTYYDAINVFSPTLWQDLHTLINTHYMLYYSDYASYLINNFESRDTVLAGQSKKTLTCSYSGENYVYTEPFAFTEYSREHVFCESWMPTYNDANYTALPEYADYHNLLPVNQNKVNVYRLNFPLGEVVTVQYQYLDGKKGLDSLGHVVFEPRDKIKGDCARAMFYQILCYDGVNGSDWYLPVVIDSATMYGQSESLLKKWNLQDPPDNYEMARNDYIQSIQSNRNPFIDHPEWVNWFGFGVFSNTNDPSLEQPGFSLFPNPSIGNISIWYENTEKAIFELFDLNGLQIYSKEIQGNVLNQIDLSNVAPGIYFYRLLNAEIFIKSGKLIIEK